MYQLPLKFYSKDNLVLWDPTKKRIRKHYTGYRIRKNQLDDTGIDVYSH